MTLWTKTKVKHEPIKAVMGREMTHSGLIRTIMGQLTYISLSREGDYWVDSMGTKYNPETGEQIGSDFAVIDVTTIKPYEDPEENRIIEFGVDTDAVEIKKQKRKERRNKRRQQRRKEQTKEKLQVHCQSEKDSK